MYNILYIISNILYYNIKYNYFIFLSYILRFNISKNPQSIHMKN